MFALGLKKRSVSKTAQMRRVYLRKQTSDGNSPANKGSAVKLIGLACLPLFIGLCVALGHMDGKPFSVAKIAAYMRVPRSTVIRRLDRLQSWGLIYRQGRRYYMHDNAFNSFLGIARGISNQI